MKLREKDQKLIEENEKNQHLLNQISMLAREVTNTVTVEATRMFENIKAMKVAFTGKNFYNHFNDMCCDNPRFSKKYYLHFYLERCNYQAEVRMPAVEKSMINIKTFLDNLKSEIKH